MEAGNDPDATKQSQASMAALLLKKQYLDDRAEEDGLWQLSAEQAMELKDTLWTSINFGPQGK